jgi:hypothetical protein
MPPEQQPSYATTPVPEKSHGFRRLIFILIFVVLIILAAGSFVVFKDPCFSENNFGAELTPECAQSLVPQQSTAQINSTESWQTYRNEEYGFEFKYPPGILKPVQIEGRGNIIDFNYYGEMNNDYATSFRIVNIKNEDGLDLKKWFSQNIDLDDLLMKSGAFRASTISEGEIINKVKGIPIPDEYLNKEVPVQGSVFIMPANKAYVLSLSGGQEIPLTQDVVDNILSTFKFTK